MCADRRNGEKEKEDEEKVYPIMAVGAQQKFRAQHGSKSGI